MKTKIEELEKRLAEIQAEIKALKQPEPKKEWFEELEKGEWCVFYDNDSGYKSYKRDTDNVNVNKRFAFKTEQQSALLAKKCALMVEMHKFAELRNGDWVADYSDANQEKFGIRLTDIFETTKRFECNDFCFGVSVKSRQIAEEMLSIFGDRINEIYNTQL